MKAFTLPLLPDSEATMSVYLNDRFYDAHEHGSRPMMVVFPGGGYRFTSDREADPIALAYLHAGYQACVVRYSVNSEERADQPLNNQPLREAAAAVRLVREHASEWGVDPDKVVISGFSAGGHLAGSLGTLWNRADYYPEAGEASRPNAMVLSYPVIASGEFRHDGSFVNLTGEGTGPKADRWSLDRLVSKDTCPAFLWHTVADRCVPVENSLLMAAALQKEHIPFSLHLYTHGEHGLSLATDEVDSPMPEVTGWVKLALEWLDSMGLGPVKSTEEWVCR